MQVLWLLWIFFGGAGCGGQELEVCSFAVNLSKVFSFAATIALCAFIGSLRVENYDFRITDKF
jgi:hypothetical protein